MPLDQGTRLGPYEVIAPLGAGGMGEVYRARDTRLDRTVAIKVMRGALAGDAESRQRFEDEARAIAALNDPHICTIHDVGHQGDFEYLVLEYLEGETLADRIRKAGALPVNEALALAIQIGDALDRAHRAGILHRDLKPGNVMLVRRSGTAVPDVKLLDFGLARKAVARSPALDASLMATMAPSMMATKPPTATAPTGFSGTVQYMAPEQLDGGEGDQRSDIFAFGCVLYEMLAGRKAFEGATAMTAIAAIMNTEPPAVPALASAHPVIDHLMRRCLEKDPERRWQSIGDVTGELRWVVGQPLPSSGPAAAQRRRLGLWQWVAAIVVLFGVLPMAMLAGLRLLGLDDDNETAPPPQGLQLEITTPPTDDVSGAISPDGRTVAFVANKDGAPMLWVRPLDSLVSRVLAGTNGASFPFWSPDNRSIGFFADDKLKRVDVDGGALLVVASAPTARGGAWGPGGIILFAPGVNAPIRKVSARGGDVEDITTLDSRTGPSHRRPQVLPDGMHFLFTSSLGGPPTNGIYLGSVDRTPPVRLIPDDDVGVFMAPDHLLTIHQDALLAYPFDPRSGKVEGEPVTLAQGLNAAGLFGASDTGILAYRAGSAQRRQLAWVDRRGTVLRTIGEPQSNGIASPELSPDEQSVAVFLHPGAGEDNDVWTIELARNLAHPITTGPPADAHPIWDPDGQHVIFNSRRAGVPGPTRFPVDGGAAQPLFPMGKDDGLGLSITRDRRYLLLRRAGGKTDVDLAAASLVDGREIVVTRLPGNETEAQFSPDGHWVAFVGNESGRPEVFVQSFPEGQGRTQVSTAGGAQVRWSAEGREIYYVAPDGKLMAVAFAAQGARPQVQAPTSLFQTHLANGNNVVGNKAQYAVSRDGRFLLNSVVESASAPIVVWVNWAARLGK